MFKKAKLYQLFRKVKGLSVPLTMGVFVIVLIGLGIVYYNQIQTQNNINSQIISKTITLKPVQVTDLIRNQYDLATKSVPLVSADRLPDFKEQIMAIVTNIAENEYGFDVSNEGNFSIMFADDIEQTISGQKYKMSTFMIVLLDIDTTILDQFIRGLESLSELPTLVVMEPVSIDMTESNSISQFYIAVYMLGQQVKND
ncbi:MAG: hypothetical protein NTV30_03650 [Chloroflexi bacterium]|nr:hypothetical protein [Chloroflexota bacterium]